MRNATAREAGGMRAEIAAMMRHSAQSWNRGDLDAFMHDYLDSSRTTFVRPDRFVHGTATIKEGYARKYFAPGAPRDSLAFEGLEVDSLAPRLAYVMAFYVLTRGDSVVARGPTTLVMEKARGRWVIVHDHSS